MPGIQEFNLGGGGSPASPEDVYPLMERMIASMDSAADRIGANIRQSMMTNQANQQAKQMGSQAAALLQNPQTSTNPTALLTGMIQIGTNNPLGMQSQQGQMVLNTLGSRAQAAQQAAAMMPVMAPSAGGAPSSGGQPQAQPGQPTGVGALDMTNGGIASGATPTGTGAPFGMIPTAPTSGQAQPTVQINPQANVASGQSAAPVAPVDAFTPTEAQYKNQYQQAIAALAQYPAGYKQNTEIRKQAETDKRDAESKLQNIAVERAKLTEQNKKDTQTANHQDVQAALSQERLDQGWDHVSQARDTFNEKVKEFNISTDDKTRQNNLKDAIHEGSFQLARIKTEIQDTNIRKSILLKNFNDLNVSILTEEAKPKDSRDQDQLKDWYAQKATIQTGLNAIDSSLAEYSSAAQDIGSQVQSLTSQPSTTQSGDVSKGKPLDTATAQQFLQQAGGDKDKARDLAKQAGYTF
jgi:hypothetical protein